MVLDHGPDNEVDVLAYLEIGMLGGIAVQVGWSPVPSDHNNRIAGSVNPIAGDFPPRVLGGFLRPLDER